MNNKLLLRIILTLFAVLFILSGIIQYNKQVSAQGNAVWPMLSFQEIASNLDYPVHIAHAGDGSGRLFIVEQPGRIRIYQSNSLLPEAFLDIQDKVRSPSSEGGSEEGLLSVAFPPGYGSSKDHFYVYYTNLSGDNQVSRFSLSNEPERADPDSEQLVIYFDHPVNANHNGGQLSFGPDGYLYIGTGDGGGGGDPFENAQDPASLLGKILRIDVEMEPAPGFDPVYQIYLPTAYQSNPNSRPMLYRVPEDNPFVGMEGYRAEIWALGLRNPWRFSFDRSTGDLFIGDVGQSGWEEIDFQPASSPGGENYGWNIMEGGQCYSSSTCDMTGLTLPVFDYPHVNDHCSVTGGFTYRGQDFPDVQGIYFFADFCSGTIWGMQDTPSGWDTQELISEDYRISSLGEDESGELYLADRRADTGAVYRIIPASP